jgi:hypothetical protein
VPVYVGDRQTRYPLAAPRPVNSPLDGPSESVNHKKAKQRFFPKHIHKYDQKVP